MVRRCNILCYDKTENERELIGKDDGESWMKFIFDWNKCCAVKQNGGDNYGDMASVYMDDGDGYFVTDIPFEIAAKEFEESRKLFGIIKSN